MAQLAALSPTLASVQSLVRLRRVRLRFSTRTVVGLAVALGCVLRLAAWRADRSFWIDEIYLALNITSRSFAELWKPLDHDQGAPIGFLMLVKSVSILFGTNEWALRLIPLAAGLGAMFAFPRVALRLLPKSGAAFAVILFAVTPKLIYYSSELKQYSSDMLVTVLLVGMVARQWGERSPARLVRLAAFGAFALWFSHPALFVLAGIGLVLAAEAFTTRDGRRMRQLMFVGGAWLMSFALCYALSLRDLAKNSYLMTYWTEYFAPVPPRNFEQAGWYLRAVSWLFEGPAGMSLADTSFAMPAVLLFGFGIWWLHRIRPWLAAGLLAPLAVALLASAFHRYPFGGRLLLFAVPLLHLGLGAGWSAVRGTYTSGLSFAVAGAVLLAPAGTAVQQLLSPRVIEDNRAAVSYIAANWQPGDAVYLSSMAQQPFDYYGARCGLDTRQIVLGRANRDDWTSERANVQQLKGRERVWVFVTHERLDNQKFRKLQFDSIGKQIDSFTAPGTSAYLYDTR